MSSKIILPLALATALITALVGTSFAQYSNNNSPRDCTTNYYGKRPC
jgi:hypothetical protein